MFEIIVGRDGQFYWRLKAANGQILCHSEGYVTRQAAQHGVQACVQVVSQIMNRR